MKKLITLFFIALTTLCLGQSKTGDYTLSIDFWPSFLMASKLNIDAKQDSNYIQFGIRKNYKENIYIFSDKVPLKPADFAQLTDFLKTYQFKIKNSIDTVGSHKEFVNGDSVLVYSISTGLDGILVSGTFSADNALKKFQFWSPKGGTPNESFIQILFVILYRVYSDEKYVNYFEQLEQYFTHGLGLKKLSDNPLKYKLYGAISSTEAGQLNAFFESLPHDKKVFIDMSNFSGMGTMFYPVIKKYFDKNNNLYWVNPTDTGLIDLYEIGIPNKNVISKRKITRIKEDKDGYDKVIYYNH